MALSRNRISFELIIILAVLAVNSFVIFSPANSLMNWYSTDDAFYYFKTAQNITEGKGVSFDGIGRANGFHPLWMLICIPVFALARFDLMLPLRVLALIAILLHAFSGALLYRTLRRLLSPTASALASALWLFSPLIHHTTVQLGMESSINAFFTLLLFSKVSQTEIEGVWSRKRLLLLGLFAALVFFSRLDNVFLVFIIGLWVLLRRSPMRYLLAWDMLLAAVSTLCAYYAVVGFYESLRPYLPSAQVMVMLTVIVRPLVYFLFSLYGSASTETPARSWLRICAGTLIASMITGVIMLIAFAAGLFSVFPRPVLLVDAGLGLLLAVGTRWFYLRLSGRDNSLPLESQGAPLKFLKHYVSIWLIEGFWYALPAAAAFSLYMGWNKFYFGALMPVSGQIKHWWGSIYTAYGRPVATFWEFFGFPQDIRNSPWSLALSLPASLARHLRILPAPLSIWNDNFSFLFAAGIAVMLAAFILANRWPHTRGKIARMGLIPLATACMAQIIYYNGSNYVGLRNWYWTSQLVLTVFTAGLLLDGIIHILSRLKVPEKLTRGFAWLVVLLMLFSFTRTLIQLVPPRISEAQAQTYLSDIRALEDATEPGALIGSTGGGVVAYFIEDRTVVNLDGLMNTADYFKRMQSGIAHEYLNQIGLDYVYSNAYIVTRTEPFEEIFSTRTQLIGEFGDGALFRYIPKP